VTDPAPKRRTPRVYAILAFLSWVHLYLGGVLGSIVVWAFGPPLQAWWDLLSGEADPHPVDLPFPWLLAALLSLLPLPWASRRDWRAASLLTIPLIAVPVWQLARILQTSH
jgi:hypothetical protein